MKKFAFSTLLFNFAYAYINESASKTRGKQPAIAQKRTKQRMTQAEFETIAPGLRKVMMSVGRNFFGNESDADDVAQEGLVALWRYRDRLDIGQTHEGLAIRIAKHCCMDMMRKRKESVQLYGAIPPDSITKEMPAAQSPQEILKTDELQSAIDEAIGQLTPGERRLYELRQIEGWELDEIASKTNISKSSVKSIISTARRKIYEELKKSLKS